MLEHLFQQIIDYEEKVGKDEYGKAIYAPPIPIAVRYEGTNKLIKLENGDKVESQYSIFTDHFIKEGDRLTIKNRKLFALEVTETPDPNNPEDVLFREVYT
jgi:hypothetical protein